MLLFSTADMGPIFSSRAPQKLKYSQSLVSSENAGLKGYSQVYFKSRLEYVKPRFPKSQRDTESCYADSFYYYVLVVLLLNVTGF